MKYKPLPKEFYLRKCTVVAKELIGKLLVRKKGRKLYSGVIVETEAYTGSSDAAAHSYRGKTKRNEVMFNEGGVGYVYFTYGAHYCFNAVVEKSDVAHAVLIRAVEPVEGISQMKKNRGTGVPENLTSGPGKLTCAFEIGPELNGADLVKGDKIFISEYSVSKKIVVKRSKRIGITKNADKLYRFYASGNCFVSKYRVSILK